MLVLCEAAQQCWRRQDFVLLRVGELGRRSERSERSERRGESGGAEKFEREGQQ